MVVTIGIPLDENSSCLKGQDEAPGRIRQAFHSDSSNYWTEESLNLERHPKVIVSHHEPGGFSTRQVTNLIQKLECLLVGADIVELNPTRGVHGMTAMAAAKCYKELPAHLLIS